MTPARLPSLDLRQKAPKVMELIDNMSAGSAEQIYAIDYLTCRLIELKLPNISDYNLGKNVADGIRQFVEERL